MNDTQDTGDHRWIAMTFVVAMLFAALVGGVLQTAVVSMLGDEIVLVELNLSLVIGLAAGGGVFAHFAATEVMALVQRHT